MTPSHFANTEAPTFEVGRAVFVSGKDLAKIYSMLIQARDAVVASGKPCIDPVDTRTLLRYMTDTSDRSICFEHLVLANRDKVIMVGNQFDIAGVQNADWPGRIASPRS